MKITKLLFDTSVLISLERRQVNAAALFTSGTRPLISSIVYAEILSGIALTNHRAAASITLESINAVKQTSSLVGFGEAEAEAFAELVAYCKSEGRPRGKFDLMIAATAKTNNATIVTHDRKANFAGLPGVKVLEI